MNLTQELERLAKLHAGGALTDGELAKAKHQLISFRQREGQRSKTKSMRAVAIFGGSYRDQE